MNKTITSCLVLALAAGTIAAHASGFGNLAPRKATATKADGGPFDVGTNAINLGIGIGSSYAYSGTVSASPAFSASFERSVVELGPGTLGIGVIGGYQGATTDLGFFKMKASDILGAVRGAFHYPVSESFDAYAGVAVGFRSISYKVEDSSSSFFNAALATSNYSGIFSAGFLGGRYFFTDAIGAFAELGYDQTYLKAGLSFKF